MDVLKDVKRAEEEAEGIERDFRSRADDLLASVTKKLETRGHELNEKIDGDLKQYNAELDRRFDAERGTIVESGSREREAVESTAHSRRDAAIKIILQRLQR